jgi:hypothetical protein
MGIGQQSRPQPTVPIPQYPQQGPVYPQPPPYNISRPVNPVMPVGDDMAMLNRKQIKQLEEANRTIQNLQNQMAAMQRSGMGTPPFYGDSPLMNAQNSYPPPSPLLQRFSGYSQYPYQQQMPFGGGGAYRDTDFLAVANIAGLNPADVALLHREYMSLTRGGMNKIDRVVFRQLLREAMIEANNENIDRAIENIFVGIDRNRDGFIDFPEFIGAFRDLLKGYQNALPDLINDQIRGNSFNPQLLSSGQITSIPSPITQQSPIVYNGPSPLIIPLDLNQSPYGTNFQGQPSSLQCIPLPI